MNHEYPCRWIAECRNRSAPVHPFPVLPAFHAGNRFAMVYEARTFSTLSDRLIEHDERERMDGVIITPLSGAPDLPMRNVLVSIDLFSLTVQIDTCDVLSFLDTDRFFAFPPIITGFLVSVTIGFLGLFMITPVISADSAQYKGPNAVDLSPTPQTPHPRLMQKTPVPWRKLFPLRKKTRSSSGKRHAAGR